MFQLFDEMVVLEPEETLLGPGMGIREGRFVRQTQPVWAVFVHVESEGDARLPQSGCEIEAVFHRNH